ncbi:MAG: A24 family peptidase [Methylococcales bacterium]
MNAMINALLPFYQEPLVTLTPAVAVSLFAIIGLLIGSFLNVVIYRLPLMIQVQWNEQARDFLDLPRGTQTPLSLMKPQSHCPDCQHKIRAYENIPIISWLLLGRQCSHCKGAITARYPLVEALTALASAVVVMQLGVTAESVLVLIITFHLIAIGFIDYDHKIIPDALVLPLLWLILLCSAIGFPLSPSASITGAAMGYLSLWGVAQGYKIWRKIDAIGHGDFKLLAVFGAISGWETLFTTITLASLIGLIFALPMLIKGSNLQTTIPFGPAIAIAGWTTLLFKPWLIFY